MRPDLGALTRSDPVTASTRLADLYQRHIGSAAALAYLLIRDRTAAEDVAQEAFVRLVGRFRHLRNPEAFQAYLRRTVVNLCRMHFRKLRVEREYLRREATRSPIHDPGPGAEPTEHLSRALAHLPYRQRAAVVLRYYEDLSEDQAAQALGTSPRAVNALVSRAMAALREEMGDG